MPRAFSRTFSRALTCALAGSLLALPLAAQAILQDGPGGTLEQGRRTVLSAPAPAAASATLELVGARLDALNLATGRVVVNGRSATLHPTALRVFGPAGQPMSGASALAAGQTLRFALEPGTAPERRIVLIFIDR
ncbi:hypothetical protein [Aquabacterium sp. OR-4]|uniref:hypothetical protein n=1 Tax=Aquabacterium sp. OR-4 TaxID=2978127 RepID=UPI0021B27AC1|nr:hypothetical protein [Aquabacterium sp. OR-4]MDT7834247.1 hypothetical protein [Aquabacterium sp. OR-4]